MKIAFLEYRPWVLWEAVKKLRDMGVAEIKMIYYHGDLDDSTKKSEVEAKCQEYGIELSDVENLGFEEKMDNLYADSDTVFFFHLTLPGDHSQYFDERINVKYAKKKQDAGENRIWFYTTAGVNTIDLLNRTFPNHCIPVLDVDVDKKQYIFDYNFIKDKIIGTNHG